MVLAVSILYDYKGGETCGFRYSVLWNYLLFVWKSIAFLYSLLAVLLIFALP